MKWTQNVNVSIFTDDLESQKNADSIDLLKPDKDEQESKDKLKKITRAR